MKCRWGGRQTRRASDEEGTTLPMPTPTKDTTCAPNHRVHRDPMHNIADDEDGKPDGRHFPPVLENSLCEMFA